MTADVPAMSSTDLDSPKRKRRWFQFSLRTMVVGVSMAALLAWAASLVFRQWSLGERFDQFEAARTEFYQEWIAYEAGTALPRVVCGASVVLLQRERALCRTVESEHDALWAHIERLKTLRERVSAPHDLATAVDQQQLAVVSERIDQANDWLKDLDGVAPR
jgi:hypothetical protein